MRLSPEQRSSVQALTCALLGDTVQIKVFGSRLDDAARGGDLDLLLAGPQTVSLVQKAHLGMLLEAKLGLPVDIVLLPPDGPRTAFQRLALTQAQDLMANQER